jgi:hypothetical protein
VFVLSLIKGYYVVLKLYLKVSTSDLKGVFNHLQLFSQISIATYMMYVTSTRKHEVCGYLDYSADRKAI